MKTLYCKSAILLAVLLSAGICLSAQTVKKDFHKEYPASGSTELKIDNQFGSLTITEGDMSTITIDVKVEVSGSSEAKVQKLLDKIDVVFKEDGNRITASTKIGDGTKGGNNEGKTSFHIDYTVRCPKNISLNLKNQFGDIAIGTHTGPVKIDIQFGSLNAVSLDHTGTKIDAQFGKVNIGTIQSAKIDAQYSEPLKIDEAGSLTIDGQYTKAEIGSIKSLNADFNYGELNIGSVSEMLNLDVNFTSVKITNVQSSFSLVDIDQNYGSVTMGIDPKAGYKLNAEVSMGSIKVPEGINLTKKVQGDLPGVSPETLQGTFGNGSSSVKIKATMGSVKIK